jgi:uncharacterized protein (TIGR03437 family)
MNGQEFHPSPPGICQPSCAQLADSTAQAGTPPPASWGGATVIVSNSKGKTRAPELAYVSPSRINLVLLTDLPTGPTSVIQRHGVAIAFSLPINVSTVAPGNFSADASGRGPAAAQLLRVHADRSQSVDSTASGIALGRHCLRRSHYAALWL